MPPCQCTSTMPGRIVFPATSIVFAPAGMARLRPTETMRFPSITIAPSSITSSPRMVMIRACVSAIAPLGTSYFALKPTFVPCSGAGGSFSGAPAMNANAFFRSRSNSSCPRDQ